MYCIARGGGGGRIVSRKVHKNFMKSNQKVCRYGYKVNQHNTKPSLPSHAMTISTVSNRSALLQYCLDELLLLVCDHTLANQRALLLMLKNNLWAAVKVEGTADANTRKGHYQANNMKGRYGLKHKKPKAIKENGLLCLNYFCGDKV